MAIIVCQVFAEVEAQLTQLLLVHASRCIANVGSEVKVCDEQWRMLVENSLE